MMFKTVSISIVLALAGTSAFADKTNFDKFTPITGATMRRRSLGMWIAARSQVAVPDCWYCFS